MCQIDLGIRADLDRSRFGLSGFYAWVNDYITYDDIGELYQPPASGIHSGDELPARGLREHGPGHAGGL